MRLKLQICIGLSALTVFTGGCGDDSATEKAPTVDLAQLDTGNFSTTPQMIETSRNANVNASAESIRLGAVLPIPLDIDPMFAFQRLVAADGRITPKLSGSIRGLEKREEIEQVTAGLVVGWESSGEHRSQPFLGRQIAVNVLRFTGPAEAEVAAQRIYDRQATTLSGATPLSIPGLTGVRALWRTEFHNLEAITVDGAMLFNVSVEDPLTEPAEPGPSIALAQKAFPKLIDAAKKYVPTPENQLAALPLDVDDMLARTLPVAETNPELAPLRNVLEPAQAALVREHRPGTVKPAFADAGVDYVASGDTRVYRTADPKAADRLMAALIAPETDYYKTTESPAQLPFAKCFELKNAEKSSSYGRYKPVCYVTFDRYLAKVTAGNPQELRQKTAAQYKLLAQNR